MTIPVCIAEPVIRPEAVSNPIVVISLAVPPKPIAVEPIVMVDADNAAGATVLFVNPAPEPKCAPNTEPDTTEPVAVIFVRPDIDVIVPPKPTDEEPIVIIEAERAEAPIVAMLPPSPTDVPVMVIVDEESADAPIVNMLPPKPTGVPVIVIVEDERAEAPIVAILPPKPTAVPTIVIVDADNAEAPIVKMLPPSPTDVPVIVIVEALRSATGIEPLTNVGVPYTVRLLIDAVPDAEIFPNAEPDVPEDGRFVSPDPSPTNDAAVTLPVNDAVEAEPLACKITFPIPSDRIILLESPSNAEPVLPPINTLKEPV